MKRGDGRREQEGSQRANNMRMYESNGERKLMLLVVRDGDDEMVIDRSAMAYYSQEFY